MANIVLIGDKTTLNHTENLLSEEFGKNNVTSNNSIFPNGRNISVTDASTQDVTSLLESSEKVTTKTEQLNHLCDNITCVEVSIPSYKKLFMALKNAAQNIHSSLSAPHPSAQ